MKTFLKIIIWLIIVALLLIAGGICYLNFSHLPNLVKSRGPEFINEKTKGRVEAESIEFVPFKGVKLEGISLLSKEKKTLFSLKSMYINVPIVSLLTKKSLDFNARLLLFDEEKPISLSGNYSLEKKDLTIDFKIYNNLFLEAQPIKGALTAQLADLKNITCCISAHSNDLNFAGELYLKGNDIHIEKLTGAIAGSSFDFIGDIQSAEKTNLNIYGSLSIALAGLKKLNPKYTKIPSTLTLDGIICGKAFIAGDPGNPQVGLKLESKKITVRNSLIQEFSAEAKMNNKIVTIDKCYGKFCSGEINIDGICNLGLKGIPTNTNINIFNLDLHQIIKEISGKDRPFHGRVFCLAELHAPLEDYKEVEGKIWLSTSGSNILRFPTFEKLSTFLRFSEKDKIGFKEASGNFLVAKKMVKSDDFTISSENVKIGFKGSLDFQGNYDVDVIPNFSQSFLSGSPSLGGIFGIVIDSSGNFLGEMKLKGTTKNPKFSFKPLAVDKIFPGGLSEGLFQLFNFKNKENENQ